MKKWIAMLLILCLLLAGCAAEEEPVETTVDPLLNETSDYEDILPEEELEWTWEEETYDEDAMLQYEDMLIMIAGIGDKVYTSSELEEGFATISECEKVVFTIDYFDTEVRNGGLCQFFMNGGDVLAPYLATALEAIGAVEHQSLFDSFVKDYDIDISDLSSFCVSSVEEYQEQYERYPFYEFDDAYIGLEPLADYLWNYVEANMEQLQ